MLRGWLQAWNRSATEDAVEMTVFTERNRLSLRQVSFSCHHTISRHHSSLTAHRSSIVAASDSDAFSNGWQPIIGLWIHMPCTDLAASEIGLLPASLISASTSSPFLNRVNKFTEGPDEAHLLQHDFKAGHPLLGIHPTLVRSLRPGSANFVFSFLGKRWRHTSERQCFRFPWLRTYCCRGSCPLHLPCIASA